MTFVFLVGAGFNVDANHVAKARATRNDKLHAAMMKSALGGNATMQIRLSKQWLGMRDVRALSSPDRVVVRSRSTVDSGRSSRRSSRSSCGAAGRVDQPAHPEPPLPPRGAPTLGTGADQRGRRHRLAISRSPRNRRRLCRFAPAGPDPHQRSRHGSSRSSFLRNATITECLIPAGCVISNSVPTQIFLPATSPTGDARRNENRRRPA